MPTDSDRLPSSRLTRRRMLGAGLATAAAALAGCSTSPRATPTTAPSAGPTPSPAADDLAGVERRLAGRLGVCAVDTGSGDGVGYRQDERFLLCSTGKVLTVAAIQRLAETRTDLLARRIHYGESDLLDYAPVTSRHVADGMTVEDLCDAAITVSDNTAANLLVGLLGGPPAVTAFARSLGDDVTRIDRIEPDLNVSGPGDLRDTTTPARMATDLRDLVLGTALPPAGRDRLRNWMLHNTTGAHAIRAGVPGDWVVADKTGSGAQGEHNDVAVIWPPGRAALVVAVYVAPSDRANPATQDAIAEATRIATSALTGR